MYDYSMVAFSVMNKAVNSVIKMALLVCKKR